MCKYVIYFCLWDLWWFMSFCVNLKCMKHHETVFHKQNMEILRWLRPFGSTSGVTEDQQVSSQPCELNVSFMDSFFFENWGSFSGYAMLCSDAIAVLSYSAQNFNSAEEPYAPQTVWLRWSPWILMPWKRRRSNWRTFLASVGLQLDQARPEMSMQCTDCGNSSIHLYMDGWLKDRDIMYQLVRADMAI